MALKGKRNRNKLKMLPLKYNNCLNILKMYMWKDKNCYIKNLKQYLNKITSNYLNLQISKRE